MLFFTLFSNVGPVNQLLVQLGWIDEAIPFFDKQITVRGLVATMNFLMWFGNTTILLMAGIMGIDRTSLRPPIWTEPTPCRSSSG